MITLILTTIFLIPLALTFLAYATTNGFCVNPMQYNTEEDSIDLINLNSVLSLSFDNNL
ncbi:MULTISPECIES: hypothetical protein [Romboutsia]|uniref:Uncharacterized protein n=1 Tax=Romboutsia hominis TaxID=1507512 RepID=A0A2P2BV52_9FIRM|nr:MULTISPECIES: hypothetical protein [Romboutsia]MCH1958941.1 hypothetical protein [Romboutsia hominis]MCH1968068.1 hypothetical protein [Romboutsia hominis]CEI74246.1 Hypothetical protein FRIFI_2729 [Romboutsia hominis]